MNPCSSQELNESSRVSVSVPRARTTMEIGVIFLNFDRGKESHNLGGLGASVQALIANWSYGMTSGTGAQLSGFCAHHSYPNALQNTLEVPSWQTTTQ